MRIVYDDTQLDVLVDTVSKIITQSFKTAVDMKYVTRRSCGINRVEVGLVKQRLGNMLREHGFEIGNDVFHAHGIGNNNRYPVYYNTPTEKQQVGHLHLNSDMYGGVYVYVTDYNLLRHGQEYKLTEYGYVTS